MTLPPWTKPSAPTLAVFVGICGALVAAFVALARRAGLPRSVCVAGALFFHLVTFRALLRRRGVPHARTGPVAPPPA